MCQCGTSGELSFDGIGRALAARTAELWSRGAWAQHAKPRRSGRPPLYGPDACGRRDGSPPHPSHNPSPARQGCSAGDSPAHRPRRPARFRVTAVCPLRETSTDRDPCADPDRARATSTPIADLHHAMARSGPIVSRELRCRASGRGIGSHPLEARRRATTRRARSSATVQPNLELERTLTVLLGSSGSAANRSLRAGELADDRSDAVVPSSNHRAIDQPGVGETRIGVHATVEAHSEHNVVAAEWSHSPARI